MEEYRPFYYKEMPFELLQTLIAAKVYPFCARASNGLKCYFYLVDKNEKIIGTSVHHCEQKDFNQN